MIWLGTSGWQYRDWRDRFCPAGVPQRLWLEHFAGARLTSWADRIGERLPGVDTYVYFTNDPGGAAMIDAVALGERAVRAGLQVTRSPGRLSRPAAR